MSIDTILTVTPVYNMIFLRFLSNPVFLLYPAAPTPANAKGTAKHAPHIKSSLLVSRVFDVVICFGLVIILYYTIKNNTYKIDLYSQFKNVCIHYT